MRSIISDILKNETIKNEIIDENIPIKKDTPEEIEKEIKSYNEFANWNVKWEMIRDALLYLKSNEPEQPRQTRPSVVDLYDIASGRGNDLNRWIDLGLKFVVGLEYNDSQMTEAITRYKKKKNMIRVIYIKGSATNFKDIRSAIQFKKVNLITNNFAMNYFFGTENDANNFMKGVSESLNVGGLFIGTATDGDFIRMIFNISGQGADISGQDTDISDPVIQTDLYYIKKITDLGNDFGSTYEFKLNTPYFESGSFSEYLISKNVLVSLAEKYNLVPIEISDNVPPVYNLSIRPISTNKLTNVKYSRPYDIASLYFGFSFIKI
jgi:SAM-dependent methyltransferase